MLFCPWSWPEYHQRCLGSCLLLCSGPEAFTGFVKFNAYFYKTDNYGKGRSGPPLPGLAGPPVLLIAQSD